MFSSQLARMTKIDLACCEHISVVLTLNLGQLSQQTDITSERFTFSFQMSNYVNTSSINVSMWKFTDVVCFQNFNMEINYFTQRLIGTRTASTVVLSCYLPALFRQRICQIGHFCPDSRSVNKNNSGFIVGITPITII